MTLMFALQQLQQKPGRTVGQFNAMIRSLSMKKFTVSALCAVAACALVLGGCSKNAEKAECSDKATCGEKASCSQSCGGAAKSECTKSKSAN